MPLIKHDIQIIYPTIENNMLALVATIDATFARMLAFDNIPLHKNDTYSFSVSQLAKQHGFIQPELKIDQIYSLLSDLGYECEIITFKFYDEFKRHIQDNLQQHLLIACFEEVTIIYGMNTDTDEFLCVQDTSFTIYADKVFFDKNQLLIIKCPILNHENEQSLFLQKRMLLTKKPFSFRNQCIALLELIEAIKRYNIGDQNWVDRLVPQIQNTLSCYPTVSAHIKDEIIKDLSTPNVDKTRIIEQLNTINRTSKTKALSQMGCYERMRAAGYNNAKLESGQCYGLSRMALNAFLAHDMETFVSRLNQIQNMSVLSFKQHKYDYNIQAFFDEIILYQAPSVFPEYFEPPQILEQLMNPANLIFDRPNSMYTIKGIYTQQALEKELSLIRKYLKECSFSFMCIGPGHAITVSYDAGKQQWLLIDPNDLPGDIYFNNKTLADAIFLAFFNPQLLVLHMKLYSRSKYQKMSQQLQLFCKSKASTPTTIKIKDIIQQPINKHVLRYLHFNSSELLHVVKESANEVQLNFINTCWSIGFYEIIKKICQEIAMVPSVSAIDQFLSSDIQHKNELLTFLLENQFEFTAEQMNGLCEVAIKATDELKQNEAKAIVSQLINAGIKSTKKILEYFIRYENIPMLVNLENQGFEFTTEHLEYACIINAKQSILFLCNRTITPSDVSIKYLILNENIDFFKILREKKFTFKPEYFEYACERRIDKSILFLSKLCITPTNLTIHYLILNQKMEILTALKNQKFKFTFEHIERACEKKFDDIVLLLYTNDLKPTNTWIRNLIWSKNIEVLSILRNKGFEFNDHHLNYACEMRAKESIEFLYKNIPDKEIRQVIKSENRQTLQVLKEEGFEFKSEHLAYACEKGLKTSILFLCQNNVKPTKINLSYLILLENIEALQALKNCGFEFTSEHMTYACERRVKQSILFLCKEYNFKPTDEWINHLIVYNNMKDIKALVEHKFKFKSAQVDFACKYRATEIILFLCDNGMNPSAEGINHLIQSDNTEVLHVLNNKEYTFNQNVRNVINEILSNKNYEPRFFKFNLLKNLNNTTPLTKQDNNPVFREIPTL